LPSPPFLCSSGNCTWNAFPTLAIGVQCRDSPELYKLSCGSSSLGFEICTVIGINNPNGYPRFSWENTKTDENPRVVFHLAESEVWNKVRLDPSLWTVPTGSWVEIDWIRATNLHKVNWTDDSQWYTDRYVLRNSTIESRQCILYSCVQEISARVDNGIYSESVQETIHGTEITTPAGESAFVYS
jgi:hypothetical protein